MESYDDYIKEKSLDELMAEAGIVSKKTDGALEERALVTKDFVEQEVFSVQNIPEQCKILLQEVTRMEDLFLKCNDFSIVFKEVARMNKILEKCFSEKLDYNSKLEEFFGKKGIASSFQKTAKIYLERMLNPKKEDLNIGSKVRRVFVPRYELRSEYLVGDTRYKHEKRFNEDLEYISKYLDERDKVFLVGDIGKVVDLSSEYVYVKFDKEGEWSGLWEPDCDYWKEKKNVAQYEAKELEVLPNIRGVESVAFNYLIYQIRDRISFAFEPPNQVGD